MSPFVQGIIERALKFVLQDLLPVALSAVPGPFGSLLKAALSTDYAQQLEATVMGKLAAISSEELSKLETECISWVSSQFMKNHPEAKAFWDAVKPPPAMEFALKDDELKALLAAQVDGTLRSKLGLT